MIPVRAQCQNDNEYAGKQLFVMDIWLGGLRWSHSWLTDPDGGQVAVLSTAGMACQCVSASGSILVGPYESLAVPDTVRTKPRLTTPKVLMSLDHISLTSTHPSNASSSSQLSST
jgi:hypothetical protein